MNKTLSIALAGFSFIIDEYAYIKLSDYLKALRNTLDSAEADEVMHDIEIRMVEIFKESLNKRDVINDNDVEKVIAQIGTPEQIDEQEEAYYSESKQSSTTEEKRYEHHKNGQRQLFRDPGQQKIAGVCAGLAQYFGLDITWMRLIWVGLFLLLWIAPPSAMLVVVLYGVLWAVLPKAESASDYLKLKGKPINFDNLKEESGKILQFANDSTQKVGEMYAENKQNINNVSSSIWNVLKYIVGTFAILCFAGSFVGIFALFASFKAGNFNVGDNLTFYLQENNLHYLMVALAGIPILIFAIAFLLLGIKIFAPKSKFKYVWPFMALLAVIWLGVLGMFAYSAISVENQFSGHNEEKENISINTTSDSIIITSKNVAIPAQFTSFSGSVYSDKKNVFKKDYPSVEIIRKDDIKTPYLIIKKDAEGYNRPLKMSVPLEIVGNKIVLPKFFSYPYEYRFRNYRVDYELVVPSHIKIIKDQNNGVIIRGDDSDYDTYENEDQDFDYDRHSKGISIGKNKIKINNNSIEFNSDDADFITINGKRMSIDSAEKVFDKMDINLNQLEDFNINIKKGKKEVKINSNR